MAHGELGTAGVADEVGQREVGLLSLKLNEASETFETSLLQFLHQYMKNFICKNLKDCLSSHLPRCPGPLAQLGVVPAPGVVGVYPGGHNVVEPE